jgi:Family of unknown function (DUF6174)
VAGRTIVLVMFAAWLLTGCAWPFGLQPNPSPAGPGASAQQAGAWTERAAYRFTFRSTCGERTLVGTFEVTVDDGSVNAYRALDGAAEAFPGTASDLPTLGDLQRRAQEAEANDEAIVTLETDPDDGHPTSIEIDWIPNAIDDEECYEITNYTPDVEP